MAKAICTQCQTEFYWRGTRGAQLADVLSPCCREKAKGKTGERTQSERSLLPKIRTVVERAHDGKDWHTPKTETLYSRGGGLFDFSHSWSHVWVTGDEVDGYQIFKRTYCAPTGIDPQAVITDYRRITVKDYQRLVSKMPCL